MIITGPNSQVVIFFVGVEYPKYIKDYIGIVRYMQHACQNEQLWILFVS